MCTLDNVSIDSIGMCGYCIIVSVRGNFLEYEKERQLCEIEIRWPGDD
ncbi:MAG: hypothetical protein FWC93_07840 [Defluviitaleaceae bacterium]|nr:hypothetical protein [Defluviitaleaceae bacterium]